MPLAWLPSQASMPYVYLWWDPVATVGHSDSQVPLPPGCLWAQIQPSLSWHWYALLGSPAANPTICAFACPWSCFCYWSALCVPVVMPSSHGSACWQQVPPQLLCLCSWPQPLLLALALNTVCVSATSPCHYTGTCSQPCSWVCVHHHTGHACCLSWSLTGGLGGAPKHPNSPWSLCRPLLQCSLRTRQCRCHESQQPEQSRHHNPQTQSHHILWCLVPCSIRPKVTAHSSGPHSTDEGLPNWSQSMETGRGDCFFKRADTYARLQG